MGLADVVRSAVATAAGLTLDFQPTVRHAAATGTRDSKGNMGHGTPVARRAVVVDANETVTTPGGEVVVCRTKVVFLGAVAVAQEDELTLPDGRTPPIRRVNAGALDSAGGKFVTVVLCD
jgi:hypothetical protein